MDGPKTYKMEKMLAWKTRGYLRKDRIGPEN
jgi:hypothetical protein